MFFFFYHFKNLYYRNLKRQQIDTPLFIGRPVFFLTNEELIKIICLDHTNDYQMNHNSFSQLYYDTKLFRIISSVVPKKKLEGCVI